MQDIENIASLLLVFVPGLLWSHVKHNYRPGKLFNWIFNIKLEENNK